MKKILFTLMLMLCTTVAMAQDFVEVSTLAGLKQAIDDAKYDNGTKSNAKIKLTADICLEGMQSTLVNTFTGEIDGDYLTKDPDTGEDVHASRVIYGGQEAFEKDNKEHKLCSKLFENVEGAKIQNLMFYKIRVQDESNDYLGLIARHAKNTEFGNLIADSISVFCNKDYAGTLVGEADHCKFLGVMNACCDVTVDGKGAGGMVGKSKNCEYFICISNTACSVFADGSNWTNDGISGGLVGDSSHDNFEACINYAMVGADQCCLGGIAGQCEYSNFYHCMNSGAVYHCDSRDFKKACDEQRARYKDVTREQIAAAALGVASSLTVIGGTVVAFATITKVANAVTAVSCSLSMYNTGVSAFLFECHIFHSIQVSNTITASLLLPARVSIAGAVVGLWPVVAVVAVMVGVTVAYEIMIGDDEVGGITGQARGGIFESCTNTGFLGCKDDNLGGIVGLGYGVTINNCLNEASFNIDEDDTTGAIIGKVDKDDSNNDKPSKVTNCLSTSPLPIVGSYHVTWEGRLDPASGNNYVRRDLFCDDQSTSAWEMIVTTDQLISGRVARWLNNGHENQIAGVKPWHQNLTTGITEKNPNWDGHPVLDVTHREVGIENLSGVFEINSFADLKSFATHVNENDQFAVAKLLCDLEMPTGETFIPIGKNESGKHFRGIFDGGGHTISGLKVSCDKAVGLFGALHTGAEIRNVIVGEGSEITCTTEAGAAGIVGTVTSGWKWGSIVIENCGSYAKVNGVKYAGGIVGRVNTSEEINGIKVHVNNCFNVGNITTSGGSSALLCGYMQNQGVVTNCWSVGSLKSSTSSTPFDTTHNEMFAGYDNNLIIENCYVVDPDVTGAGINPQSGVSSYTSAVLASGELTYRLNGNTNDATKGLGWQQNLGSDAAPVFGDKGVYHTRTVGNKYGTVCLPFALKSDDNIRYYSFNKASEDTKLVFDYAEEIPAGTPALFIVGTTGEISFCDAIGTDFRNTPVASEGDEWNFLGTYSEKKFEGDAAQSIYYISGGVVKNGKKSTIAPYRAYFDGPSIYELTSNGAKAARVRLVIDGIEDEALALEFVANDLLPEQSGKAYTLFGTEAGEGYRGIVVREGKKVLR